MRITKALLIGILVTLLILVVSTAQAAPAPAITWVKVSTPTQISSIPGTAAVYDLIVGGGSRHYQDDLDVGNVYLWTDAGYLHVLYHIVDHTSSDTTDNWYIGATHVLVSYNAFNTDTKTAPGSFPISSLEDYATDVEFKILMSTIPGYSSSGGTIYIATHANVEQGPASGQDLLNWYQDIVLPTQAYINVYAQSTPGTEAYLKVKVNYWIPDSPINLGSYYTGTGGTYGNMPQWYWGYCLDPETNIDPGSSHFYTANVYSSYDAINVAGLVENYENMDKVNWVINNYVVGQDSGGLGPYTCDDIQLAIWWLLDGNDNGVTGEFPTNFLILNIDDYSLPRALQIVNAALGVVGEYTPPVNGKLVIVLSPPGVQPMMIVTPFVGSDGGTGTAWGAGVQLNGGDDGYLHWQFDPAKSWATYLQFPKPATGLKPAKYL